MASDKLQKIRDEQSRRERELLRVYRPSDKQEPVHRSKASEIIVRGGKRSGKSVCISALFASRVTGLPIVANDGSLIPSPWPAPSPDYPRIFWIIGWDTKHIGQTIYRLLFESGQGGSFRIIRDEATGEWRPFNRACPRDRDRIKESRLPEPLIPDRMLAGSRDDSFDWEDKKANQFNSVRLKNGATIFAYPSSARNPKQGDAVSGIWIDEDIQFPEHLKEWQDRLTDEEGWFVWSVWPHMKNEALMDLINRAEMATLENNPQIESFQLIMSENPFLSQKGKMESLGRMESEEEIARRDRGEILTDALSMYSFESSIHVIKKPTPGFTGNQCDSEAYNKLLELYMRFGEFPFDWTRYLGIDPSHTRTAILSFVVPPREFAKIKFGNVAICEWELVARRFTASQIADAIAEKTGGRRYEAYIMDAHAGRQTHAGRDESTFGVFSNAFEKAGLKSRQTSSMFIPGCDDRQRRFRAVRELLRVQHESGIPGLLFVENATFETRKEFSKYRKKVESRGSSLDMVLDEPANPRVFDCMAALEYFAAYIETLFAMNQAYINPEEYLNKANKVVLHVRKLLAKSKQKDGADVVYMGGGR